MTLDIMMPFYGDVRQMRDAVNSVLRQTSENWRLVVIDDQYPDPSIGEWLQAMEDPRVIYLRNDQNLGSNGNFRRCVELAENELTVIMGCDDVLLPNYVSWVEQTAELHPEVTVFQPGVVVIDENDALSNTLVEKMKAYYRPKKSSLIQGEEFATTILRGNWLYFPSLAWRTDELKKYNFPQGYEIVLDMALLLDMAMDRRSLLYNQTVAFMYRRHSNSYSSSSALDGMRFDEERRFFSEIATRSRALGWQKAALIANLHLSSRLHAATLLPKTIAAQNWTGSRALSRHIIK